VVLEVVVVAKLLLLLNNCAIVLVVAQINFFLRGCSCCCAIVVVVARFLLMWRWLRMISCSQKKDGVKMSQIHKEDQRERSMVEKRGKKGQQQGFRDGVGPVGAVALQLLLLLLMLWLWMRGCVYGCGYSCGPAFRIWSRFFFLTLRVGGSSATV
jgi:hypothetical protein